MASVESVIDLSVVVVNGCTCDSLVCMCDWMDGWMAARAGSSVGADVVHKIGGIQRIMVQTMNAANAIPHFGFNEEIVVDELVRFGCFFALLSPNSYIAWRQVSDSNDKKQTMFHYFPPS